MNGESDEADEQRKTEDRSNEVPPVPSDAPPISNVPPDNTQGDANEQPDWQRRQYRVKLAVQLATVIVGVAVAFIYGCQLNEMRKTSRIAADNYALQTTALHIDQRAYVGVLDTPKTVPAKGEKLKVTIVVKNFGKTFAREVAMNGFINFIQKGTEPTFDMTKNADAVRHLLLAPTGPYNFEFVGNEPLTEDAFEKLQTGASIVFSSGWITYYDAFSCVHWTIYCYTLDFASGTWSVYKRNNDADNDQCSEK